MYAIIATGGKQYKVSQGDVIDVESLTGEAGQKIEFNDVLAMGEGESLEVGAPKVDGAKVEGEIVKHFRGDKLIAFKMKRRKGFRKKIGHRQEITKVRILSIAGK